MDLALEILVSIFSTLSKTIFKISSLIVVLQKQKRPGIKYSGLL
jgi:hypothetical protein